MSCATFCFKLCILVVPVSYLFLKVLTFSTLYDRTVGRAAVLHYAAMAVRDGVETGKHGTPLVADSGGDIAAALWYALMSFFGGYRPTHASLLPLDLTGWRYPTDAEGMFCRDVLGYMWGHPNESGLQYPAVYAHAQNVDDWIRVCRAAYASLGEEEQALLLPYREAGAVPPEVLVPALEDHDDILRTSRKEDMPTVDNVGRKLSADDVGKLLRDSMAFSSWAGVVDEPPEGILEYLASLNLREPVKIPSDWAELGAAVKAGRIVTFDAGPLLPEGFVNISMASIARQEGERASRIAVWHDFCKASPLDKFAAVREAFVQAGANAKLPWNLALEKTVLVNGSLPPLDEAKVQKLLTPFAPHLGPLIPPCMTGYVHTRRLPNFHKRLPEVEELLGIKEDVLRTQSQLWAGTTPGGFHYDEESNLYIQLAGESFAFLVPQNFTDFVAGSHRHPWGSEGLPSRSMLAADPLLKEVPIYMVHLRAGDGIILQGRAYHKFMAQTQDRIALNFFFIPGWRRMEYTPADWYSKEARTSLPRLALRQLFARTLARLWDEVGEGIVYMGAKLEYL